MGEATARARLGPTSRRFRHVRAVARLAIEVSERLHLDNELLVSSAWMHDVGYAVDLVDTGFHALDGARFLRREGVPGPVVNLVAHHSHAVVEAELRGLRSVLESEFPYDASLPHDLLCYCDMTTGPSGHRVTVEERLREIRARYGPDDIVTLFIDCAERRIIESVQLVEARLSAGAQSK